MKRAPRFATYYGKWITNTATLPTPGKHTARMKVAGRDFGREKAMRLFAIRHVDGSLCRNRQEAPGEYEAALLARRIPHLKTAKNRRRFLSHLNSFDLL